MRKAPVLVGEALLLIGLGFTAGVLVGQRHRAEEGSRPASRPISLRPAESAPSPSAVAELLPDPTKEMLTKRIVDLESELRTARGESRRAPAPVGDNEVERQALEDLLSMNSGKHRRPDALYALIHDLAALDERSARYFVAVFRSLRARTGVDQEQSAALQLALFSGGPDAAELIQELLNDPAPDGAMRKEILSELTPKGGEFFSARRVPVGEALASSAIQLARSTDVSERIAGANLLGGARSDASRAELLRLLEDGHSDVQVAAARSLGLVGGPAARKALEACAAQTGDGSLQQAAAAALKDFDPSSR